MKSFFQKNDGFTLVEVLISITLMMILLSGIVEIMTVSLRVSCACECKIEAQQTARFAVDSMVRELKFAKKITIKNQRQVEMESDKTGKLETITYFLDNKIIRREKKGEIIAQPLTSAMISKLEFTPESGTVNTVFILLTSRATDHSVNPPKIYEYTIETAVSKLNI